MTCLHRGHRGEPSRARQDRAVVHQVSGGYEPVTSTRSPGERHGTSVMRWS